jgi:iron complex transport system substrate-binding protein
VRSYRLRPGRVIAGLLLTATLAACGTSGASVAPTIPPDATGSLLPAATATPAASPSASAAPAFPVTLTDDDGKTVELKEAPEQIVSLTPAETEILYALGAGDRLVGKVEDVANFPPEAKDVPVVATFTGVDVEKIVAAGTDQLIPAWHRAEQRGVVKEISEKSRELVGG